MSEYDKINQRIGEFVVCFQGLEDIIRQIGWLILDPHRKESPPRSLRNLSNKDLLDKVEVLFHDLLDDLDIDAVECKQRKKAFSQLVANCHTLRQYRNKLLHCTYDEADEETGSMLQLDPKLKYHPETGEPEFSHEVLTESGIAETMKELAPIAIGLNLQYTQLIHWTPFDHLRKKA